MFRVEENSGRKGAENQAEDVEENQRNTVSAKTREEHFEKSGWLTVTVVLATTTKSILQESTFKLHSRQVQPQISCKKEVFSFPSEKAAPTAGA